jgi:hypothetical protein
MRNNSVKAFSDRHRDDFVTAKAAHKLREPRGEKRVKPSLPNKGREKKKKKKNLY